MSELKVGSWNVRGVRTGEKLRRLAVELLNFDLDIVVLCDTRLNGGAINDLKNFLPEYNFYNNYLDEARRGVSIGFRSSLDIQILDVKKDNEGNFILIRTRYCGKFIIFGGLYGPNVDTPRFYEDLFAEMHSMGQSELLLMGDFNLVLNQNMDTTGYLRENNINARQTLLDFIANFALVDIYRTKFPNNREYTWINPGNTDQKARLDMFLSSESIYRAMKQVYVHPLINFSDHKMLQLNFDLVNIKTGNSVWQLDRRFLKNRGYIELVKRVVVETVGTYYDHFRIPNFLANCSRAEREEFLNIRDFDYLSQLPLTLDDSEFLNVLFNNLKNESITFQIQNKILENHRCKEILKEIRILRGGDQQIITNLTNEYNELIEEQAREFHLNKNIQWVQLGEKVNQFFLKSESNAKKAAFFTELYVPLQSPNPNDPLLSSEQSTIEKELQMFYSQLYSSRDDTLLDMDPKDFLGPNVPHDELKLSDELKAEIDKPLTKGELYDFLKGIKRNTAPGSSGFGYDFVFEFWEVLGTFIHKCALQSYRDGILPDFLRVGLLKLIPKGVEKDRRVIGNWRPLVMQESIYKIFSGAFTKRMNMALQVIINPNQNGFIPSRSLNENVRLIESILDYGNKNERGGVIIQIDFKKAFDSLSHKFLVKCLDYFNFGPHLKRWIKTFINGFDVSIVHSGNLIKPFRLCRGVKQGDCIAPCIFINSPIIFNFQKQHFHSNNKCTRGYTVPLLDPAAKSKRFY